MFKSLHLYFNGLRQQGHFFVGNFSKQSRQKGCLQEVQV